MDSIIKISSQESYTFESDLTLENIYPLFKRTYCLEYFDKTDKKKVIFFSINNKTKEEKLMEALKSKTTNDTSQ